MAKKKKTKKSDGNRSDDDGIELTSFEESLSELEQIVEELETGKLSLAESLEKYEKGIRNLKSCHQILEHAENQIRILTGVGRDGSTTTSDFEVQKTELHQRSEKRRTETVPEESNNVSPEHADDENVVDDSRTLF